MSKPRCYVCGTYDNIFEEHHLIPQARGGKEGPKVYLCVKHHKEAHYLARSKRPLEEIVNSKLRKIVQIIRIADQRLPHAKTIKVTIDIPLKLHNLIKEEARIGKKKSIPRMILLILIKYFKEKVR